MSPQSQQATASSFCSPTIMPRSLWLSCSQGSFTCFTCLSLPATNSYRHRESGVASVWVLFPRFCLTSSKFGWWTEITGPNTTPERGFGTTSFPGPTIRPDFGNVAKNRDIFSLVGLLERVRNSNCRAAVAMILAVVACVVAVIVPTVVATVAATVVAAVAQPVASRSNRLCLLGMLPAQTDFVRFLYSTNGGCYKPFLCESLHWCRFILTGSVTNLVLFCSIKWTTDSRWILSCSSDTSVWF